jgi:hypothetical protein
MGAREREAMRFFPFWRAAVSRFAAGRAAM